MIGINLGDIPNENTSISRWDKNKTTSTAYVEAASTIYLLQRIRSKTEKGRRRSDGNIYINIYMSLYLFILSSLLVFRL